MTIFFLLGALLGYTIGLAVTLWNYRDKISAPSNGEIIILFCSEMISTGYLRFYDPENGKEIDMNTAVEQYIARHRQ